MFVCDVDGSYRPGPRPAAWQERALLPPATRRVLDRLALDLGCTATLWSIHGHSLRCIYRRLDEHSPALSTVGNVRRAELLVVGGGLVMREAQLADPSLLEAQAHRTPLQPTWNMIRRIVRDCRDHGVYDDHAAFWTGSRRRPRPSRPAGLGRDRILVRPGEAKGSMDGWHRRSETASQQPGPTARMRRMSWRSTIRAPQVLALLTTMV